jgi:hypothetical protein
MAQAGQPAQLIVTQVQQLCIIKVLLSRAGHPLLFSVSDTRSFDTSTPVFDTDAPILFKILGSDTPILPIRYFTKTQKSHFHEEKSNPPLSPLQVYMYCTELGTSDTFIDLPIFDTYRIQKKGKEKRV